MRRIAGGTLAAALIASAVLHAYWALGGSWFLATALNMDVQRLPENLVMATWVMVAGMLLCAWVALARAGAVRARMMPDALLAGALWLMALAFTGGAIYDALIPRFWDRWVFAPIFAALAVLAVVAALSRLADAPENTTRCPGQGQPSMKDVTNA
jgi:hypothetical protein